MSRMTVRSTNEAFDRRVATDVIMTSASVSRRRPARRARRGALLLLVACGSTRRVHAFGPPPSSAAAPPPPPTAASSSARRSSRWSLTANFGREPTTWMDAAWGASGARLLLPIALEVSRIPPPAPPSNDRFESVCRRAAARITRIAALNERVAATAFRCSQSYYSRRDGLGGSQYV